MEALETFGRAAALPLAALWAGVAITVGAAARRQDRELLVIAAAALAWIALVAAMAAAGYAGLPRFMAPAAAIACVLGAVGLTRIGARGAAEVRAGRIGLESLAAIAVVLVFAGQGALRVAGLPDQAAEATSIAASQEELFELLEAREMPGVAGCAEIAVDGIEQTALAWRLGVPASAIKVSADRPPGSTYFERRKSGWGVELGGPNCGAGNS